MAVIADTPTVLWTLYRQHNWLTCRVQLLRQGLQLHMAVDDQAPYLSRIFETGDDLHAWADQERQRCEAEGWT